MNALVLAGLPTTRTLQVFLANWSIAWPCTLKIFAQVLPDVHCHNDGQMSLPLSPLHTLLPGHDAHQEGGVHVLTNRDLQFTDAIAVHKPLVQPLYNRRSLYNKKPLQQTVIVQQTTTAP